MEDPDLSVTQARQAPTARSAQTARLAVLALTARPASRVRRVIRVSKALLVPPALQQLLAFKVSKDLVALPELLAPTERMVNPA